MSESTREIYWFGTSGSLQKQAIPVQMNLSEKLPTLFPVQTSFGYPTGQQIDFSQVKIVCSWSKTLSVTNIVIADLRAINEDENFSKLSNVLERLSKNWD